MTQASSLNAFARPDQKEEIFNFFDRLGKIIGGVGTVLVAPVIIIFWTLEVPQIKPIWGDLMTMALPPALAGITALGVGLVLCAGAWVYRFGIR